MDQPEVINPREEKLKWQKMNNMERISYLLTKLMKYVEVVTRRTEHFVKVIASVISSMNPAEYDLTMQNLQYLKECIVAIPGIVTDGIHELANNALKLYSELEKTDAAMEQLISILNNNVYEKLSRISVSASLFIDAQLNRKTALKAYNDYLTHEVESDAIITDYITEMLLAEDVNNAYDFIMQNSAIVNKFTVKLISKLIPMVTGEQRSQLQLLVEKQKDDVIGASKINISGWSGIQALILRYNLTPVTASMTKDKLCAEIASVLGIQPTYDSAKSIMDNLVLSTHGVIMINISNSSPIEFDLRPVASAEYIAENNLMTNPISGLTKTVLARFKTAVMLPVGADTGFSGITPLPTYTISANDKQQYIIVETINGDLYRALGADGGILVPRERITGMIEGISTRYSRYNEIQSESIIKRAVDSHAAETMAEFENSNRDTSGIPAAIVEALTKSFSERADTIRDIGHFRDQAMAADITRGVLLKVFKHVTGTKGRGHIEYLVTFVAKFDHIFSKFMTELERKVDERPIAKRTFTELAKNELKKELISAYRAIIESVASDLDKLKLWENYDTSLKQFAMDKRFLIV